MPNFNQFTGMGNMTRDPEVRYSPKGTAVSNFCLAINHSYKTSDGEKREEVLFLDCSAFGKTAETIAQYVKKGQPLLVGGRLKSNEWEDKASGHKRSKIGCIVDQFQFIGGGKSDDQDEPPARPAGKIDPADMPARATKPASSALPIDGDDDVPF